MATRRVRVLAVVVGTLLALTACGQATTTPYAEPTTSVPPAPAPLWIGSDDDGRTFDVALEQRIHVELEPTGNGVWTDPAVTSADGLSPGDPGIFRDRVDVTSLGPATADFLAVRESTNTLTAHQDVPCLHASPPCEIVGQRSFAVTINVHPQGWTGSPLPTAPSSPQPSATADASPAPAPGQPRVVLTNADSGKTVTLTVGQELMVSLDPVGERFDAPRAETTVGLYRAEVAVADRTTALFAAVAPASTTVTSRTDAACFHSTQRCARPQASVAFHIEIRDRNDVALTLAADVTSITAGNTPTLSGAVTDGSGRPIANLRVSVFGKRYGATTYDEIASLDSGGDGSFRLAVRPLVQTAYVVRAGAAASGRVVIGVATRVRVDAPAAWPVGRAATFSGGLVPGHVRAPVGVGRLSGGRFVVLAQSPTDSLGRFAVRVTLPPGPATYVVFTSAHGGNRRGSASLALDVR